jgi:hypothetical protein
MLSKQQLAYELQSMGGQSFVDSFVEVAVNNVVADQARDEAIAAQVSAWRR